MATSYLTQFKHGYKAKGFKGVYRCLLGCLPQRFSYGILFLKNFGRFVNRKHPTLMDEKFLILYTDNFCKNPLVTRCADKVAVRDYVLEKTGRGGYLTDLLGVYDDAADIPWEGLPERFVLKCNHGSGYNLFVTDKQAADKEAICKKLNYWMAENYGIRSCEWQYKNIVPKILIEGFLETKSGVLPPDYKFFCAGGKPMFCMIVTGREGEPRRACVDENFEDLGYIKEHILEDPKPYRPASYEEMWDLAGKLSEDFPAVRVDLYDVEGRVVFGELTFTSNGCCNYFFSEEAQLEVGARMAL